MKKHKIYSDKYVELYNCDCKLFEQDKRKVDLVFADPPYDKDLTEFETVLMKKCKGHITVF